MVKKNFLKSSLIVLVALAMVLPVIPTISFAASKPVITYSAHMQTYGWDSTNKAPNSELTAKDAAKNYAGRIGESKRMEALEVNLSTLPGVTLKYRAHVQTYGWQDWVTADTTAGHTAIAGTTGESKRVEALQISVEGLKEQGYKLLYRAHVQTYGWLDWVDADDPNAYAGTSGESKRMEAFEIVVLPASEYTYEDEGNGTHSISYKGVLQGTSKCSYGEWTSTTTGSTEYEQACALCGHKNGEKTTLQDALTKAYTNGTEEVSAKNVTLGTSETLTVPAGVTLEVSDTLTVPAGGKLIVDGDVVTKYVGSTNSTNNIKVSETGSFTLAGKYDKPSDSGMLGAAMECDYLTDIIFEEGSVDQTITTTATVDAEELTISLNGTKVNATPSSTYMMEVNGKLRINDGKFISNGKGIEVANGSLEVSGGSIEATDEAVVVRGDKNADIAKRDLSKSPVTLSNVDVKTTAEYAIGALGNNGTVTLNNVTVTVDSPNSCLLTNALTKNTAFKVTGGKFVSNGDVVAYLPGVGDNVFTNATLEGADGIEVAGGSLTVRNSTITASRVRPTSPTIDQTNGGVSNIGVGQSNPNGAAILLKLGSAFGLDTEKFDLTVTNSTVKSAHTSAIMVLEDHSLTPISSIKAVNTNYSGSTIQGFTAVEGQKGDAIVYALRKATQIVVK